MAIGLTFLILLAIGLIAGPFVVPAFTPIKVGMITTGISAGSGLALLLLVGIILIITKLYVRAKANEAFVRTGTRGKLVVKDGGALVIPFLHEFLKISLETMKLEVQRTGKDALITSDNLRVDIGSEFYVKVEPTESGISQAATSIGERMQSRDYANRVKEAVEDKLISALRQVAATKTLTELHTDRESFVDAVSKAVADDLAHNGLVLEAVTISKLDQTDIQYLDDNNVFDARGKRTIAEITEKNHTERNELEQEGRRARTEKNVTTDSSVLELNQKLKVAEAKQKSEIAIAEAQKAKDAKEKAIEATKAVETAEIQKQQAVESAGIEKQKQLAVADEAKQQSIAEAAKARSAEEAQLAKANATREREQQQIKTVEIEETAKRDKAKAVIGAQADAEKKLIGEQRTVDAATYKIEKEAGARKAAADADAEAITKKADAEANAAKAEAEGAKAGAMVPVEVEREKVRIDQERIENVVKPELEAREQHGRVAQEFEISMAEVQASKEVRIASAQAFASFGTNIKAQLYGKPEEVTRMMSSLVGGQAIAEGIKGFAEGGGQPILDTVSKISDKILGSGKEETPDNGGQPTPPKTEPKKYQPKQP
jgi:flotillin